MGKTLDEVELRALLSADPSEPRAPSPYLQNARYLTSLDGFNIKRPAIPAHVFRAERRDSCGNAGAHRGSCVGSDGPDDLDRRQRERTRVRRRRVGHPGMRGSGGE